MKESETTTRRSFLDILLGTGVIAWLASVLYPVLQYLKVPEQAESTPTSVVAAKLTDLKPNQGMVFRFGNQPAILVRAADGNFRAFSAICTHLECTVQYRGDMQKIWCACHNGVYDLNGQNIAGPPPRPLQEFKVVTKGNDVLVAKA
jgi:cytochrome b6-f complex iron-sulfur subunit